MSYKVSTATQRKLFTTQLKQQQKSMTLEELSMEHSPKAFLKDATERKPIMLGWEWERKMLFDMESTVKGSTVLSKIIKGPLGLYVNVRYEVNDLELVSIPCTLNQHKKWMDTFLFKKELELDSILGKPVVERGIHIHIGKDAFSQDSLKRFLVFISDPNNKVFVNKIAGRNIRESRWCRPVPFSYKKDKTGKITGCNLNVTDKLILEGGHGSKSVAVHCNSDLGTVELRIFKTTSNKDMMYRNLEFADALTRFVAVHTYEEMNAKDFMEYVVRNKVKYPHLAEFKYQRERKSKGL